MTEFVVQDWGYYGLVKYYQDWLKSQELPATGGGSPGDYYTAPPYTGGGFEDVFRDLRDFLNSGTEFSRDTAGGLTALGLGGGMLSAAVALGVGYIVYKAVVKYG